MYKRGQVTIFIIVGVVIVLGLVIGSFFVLKNNTTQTSVARQYEALDSSIDTCVEEQAENAISILGIGGGQITQTKETISGPFGNSIYALKGNKNNLPSLDTIEAEIEEYIILTIPNCYDAEEYEYDIVSKNPSSQVKIYEDYVRVFGNIDLIIASNDTTQIFERKYMHDIPVRMGKIHDLSNQIIEKQKTSGLYVPLTFLTEFDTEIVYDYIDENTILYIIHDENSKINNVTYNFLFAVEPVENE